MFCGEKLAKSEEGMICFSCNTRFTGVISESRVDGMIERSICMDCLTVKQKVEVEPISVPFKTQTTYEVEAEV